MQHLYAPRWETGPDEGAYWHARELHTLHYNLRMHNVMFGIVHHHKHDLILVLACDLFWN